MKYLQVRPTRASGEPTIKGTRIRIGHVLKLMVEGMTLEEIHSEWYPWLPVATLRGAVTEAIEHIQLSSHA